jgi:hypothetical protein
MPSERYERAIDVFSNHDAFEQRTGGFELTTARFENHVTISETDDGLTYELSITAPTLSAATSETVAPVVEEGWFETFELRVGDGAMAIRGDVRMDGPHARIDGDVLLTEATIEATDPKRGPGRTKAIIDYVVGTYAEGVVPGYDYHPPVSDLLASARHDDGEDAGGGPMPL